MSRGIAGEVREALRATGRPMDKRAILSACPSAKTMQQIHGAMFSLATGGEVEKLEDGTWRLIKDGALPPPAAPAPSTSAANIIAPAAPPTTEAPAATATSSPPAQEPTVRAQPPAPAANEPAAPPLAGVLSPDARPAAHVRDVHTFVSDSLGQVRPAVPQPGKSRDLVHSYLQASAGHAREALQLYIEQLDDPTLNTLLELTETCADALADYEARR